MADTDPCDRLDGPAEDYCRSGSTGDIPDGPDGGRGITGGAADQVQELAHWIIDRIEGLLAPSKAWAPQKADNELFAPFLWLGQHLAVSIFFCVVVVCALSAWQGAPRLKQMGHSTGWTLVSLVGMASVPGVVALLNRALSEAFAATVDSNEFTLFGAINHDLKAAGDAQNPLSILIIVSALVVALGFAGLVFLVRNPAILAFICVSPLVLASLARGGDTTAVQAWAQRLLGVMFAPFALILLSPFVTLFKGSLIMDAVLLFCADALMLRMIFHGIPYFGPRMARAARSMVESRTDNWAARRLVRAGVPDFAEEENVPRGPRRVSTPGRALGHDGGVLASAYGVRTQPRPGRLTTESAAAQIGADAERTQRLSEARRQARARNTPGSSRTPAPAPAPPAPWRPTLPYGAPPPPHVPPVPHPGRSGGSGGSGGTPTTP